MKLKPLIAALAASASVAGGASVASAQTDPWGTPVAWGTDSATYVATITHDSPTTRRIWEKSTTTDPTVQWRTIYSLKEVDCSAHAERVLQETDMDATDHAISGYSQRPWRFEAPGTMGDIVVSYACTR